jgi:hypothetical protein
MTIQINAATRLAAYNKEKMFLDLELSGSANFMQTMANFLAAVEHNSAVGHSTMCVLYVDGDGADRFEVKGLPKNVGADMAAACSAYGDNMTLINLDSASAINVRLNENDDYVQSRTMCYPKCKDGTYTGHADHKLLSWVGDTESGSTYNFYQDISTNFNEDTEVQVVVKDGVAKLETSPLTVTASAPDVDTSLNLTLGSLKAALANAKNAKKEMNKTDSQVFATSIKSIKSAIEELELFISDRG